MILEISRNTVINLLSFFSVADKVVTHSIAPNVTEMGGDRRKASYGPFIELQQKQGLLPSHCVITNMDGVVTVSALKFSLQCMTL